MSVWNPKVSCNELKVSQLRLYREELKKRLDVTKPNIHKVSITNYSQKTITDEEILEDKVSELKLILKLIRNSNIKNIKHSYSKHITVCPMCTTSIANSEHHIMPRQFGGSDGSYNKIKLCVKCHDIVELSTCEIIKIKPNISIERLKRLIVTGAFI